MTIVNQSAIFVGNAVRDILYRSVIIQRLGIGELLYDIKADAAGATN
jgi:hypothetical protein